MFAVLGDLIKICIVPLFQFYKSIQITFVDWWIYPVIEKMLVDQENNLDVYQLKQYN